MSWLTTLQGKEVVLSGTFYHIPGWTQDFAREEIVRLGGTVSKRVRNSTDVIIRGKSKAFKFGDFGDAERQLAEKVPTAVVIDANGLLNLTEGKRAEAWAPNQPAPPEVHAAGPRRSRTSRAGAQARNQEPAGGVEDSMDLSNFILDIATGYDRLGGMGTPTQTLLRRANQKLAAHVPGGIVIKGRGGQTTPTYTPWVGYFDPDETDSPQRGLYVAHIFAEDLVSVSLTIQQGITELTDQLGEPEARKRLAADATAIRSQLPPETLMGLDVSLDLGSKGARQRGYEAGNVVALRYEVDRLPSEHQLRADLLRFLALYQLAVTAKRELLLAMPGVIASSSPPTDSAFSDPLRDFKPKSDSDYLSFITGRQLTKSRRHETLIAQYGEWAATRGWEPSTKEHPKDLVLRRRGEEWLVEAKVVYNGKAADAVRAALGQLYEYRHFKACAPSVRLLALFTEDIGDAFTAFLESCGIATVARHGGAWIGSGSATAAGLSDQ
jgi:5-methylcytosine-specific restriction enzyme MrcB-like protein